MLRRWMSPRPQVQELSAPEAGIRHKDNLKRPVTKTDETFTTAYVTAIRT
jgi:hypothetical protein